MDLQLENKVVMITGSTGGVGEALTRAFAKEGCKLAISSTKQAKLDKFLPTLEIDPEKLITFVTDVTQEDQVEKMVTETVKHYGQIDVLINNAGFEGRYAPITEQTFEDFMKVYNINIFGVMYGMKYALPHMQERKSGAIVNIASNGSFVGSPNMAPYVSSKHAVAGLSKCVALENAAENIRVNCVCPGAIDTQMMRAIEHNTLGDSISTDDAMQTFSNSVPDGRYAKPEEVADLTVYLASERAGHITGECIRQDGGLTAM